MTDKQIEEFYKSNNPYENYGKKVLAECDSCSTELIEGDEVYAFNGGIYCSKNCVIDDVELEKRMLTREWYAR